MNSDRRAYWFLFLVAAIQLSVIVFIYASRDAIDVFTSDLPVWQFDGRNLWSCWQGVVADCKLVSRFPLAYTINSALADYARDLMPSYIIIAMINIVFFLLPFVFYMFFFVSNYSVRPLLYWIAMFFSPLVPAYVISSHLEIQSSVVLGFFFLSLSLLEHETNAKRRLFLQAIIFLTGILNPLYKDTTAILILMTFAGVVVLKSIFNRYRPDFALYLPDGLNKAALAGLVIGQSLAFSGNWLKYTSILPLEYLQNARDGYVDLPHAILFFIFSIISPNGGILIFWSLTIFILVVLIRKVDYHIQVKPLVMPLIFAGLQLVSLARWWSPFGWVTWGNRLMIPSLLALIIVLIATIRPDQAAVSSERKEAKASAWPIHARYKPYAILIVAGLVLCSAYYVLISHVFHIGELLFESATQWEICDQAEKLVLFDEQRGFSGMRSPEYYECAWNRLIHIPMPFTLK